MEIVYLYDGSFDGLLSCIFDSYLYKEVPAAIISGEDEAPLLFSLRTVTTDRDHAVRVLRKVSACSPYAANLLHKGYLTCLPDRELYLYRLVAKLLREGPGFLTNQADETLYPVFKAVRHLNGEAHLLKGFTRFSQLGPVLGGEIAPKNRVLPLLRSHFCARYRNDAFFLYDRTHREVLFYSGGRSSIQPLEGFEMSPPDEAEARYRTLWKCFYDTVAIRERENPRCRMSNMPKRYWGTMTEFQGPEHFQATGSPAFDSVPGAPGGRSAPGIPPGSGPSAPASGP